VTREGERAGDAQWIQVRVRPGSDRDAVLAALFAGGSAGVHEVGDELVTAFPSSAEADAVMHALRTSSPDAELSCGEVARVDWSQAWRDGVRTHDLGALSIAPPWLAAGLDPARTVVIDPGMAFGTGEHATTRGVIRLLPAVLRTGDRVADLGAGSAVLAIAAVKLGAASVAAIEMDPDAIGNAEANVVRNGVAGRVVVLEGDAELLLPLVAPVRLVLANIISSVLVQLLPVLDAVLPDDGAAVISGILHEERPAMLEALAAHGWGVTAEDAEEAWWSAAIARR